MIFGNRILKDIIETDYATYDIGHSILSLFTYSEKMILFRYVKNLRYLEYFKGKFSKSKGIRHFIYALPYYFCFVRHRKKSARLSVSIAPNTCGKGLHLVHLGFRHIDSFVRIGDNCTILPQVLIGKKRPGSNNSDVIIGNNCYIGTGVTILGPVSIADNVTIAAGAVVTSDILESSVIVGGVPSEVLKKKDW